MGVVAGYLRWSGMVPSGPQAIAVVEKILGRQMGPSGPRAGGPGAQPGRHTPPSRSGAR